MRSLKFALLSATPGAIQGRPGAGGCCRFPISPSSSCLETGSDLPGLLSPQHCWAGHGARSSRHLPPFRSGQGLITAHHCRLTCRPVATRIFLFGIMLQHMHPERRCCKRIGRFVIRPSAQKPTLNGCGKVEPGMSLLADWLGREPQINSAFQRSVALLA